MTPEQLAIIKECRNTYKLIDAELDKLPDYAREGYFDNPMADASARLVDTLLAHIFTQNQLGDIYYFMYEWTPQHGKMWVNDIEIDTSTEELFYKYLETT